MAVEAGAGAGSTSAAVGSGLSAGAGSAAGAPAAGAATPGAATAGASPAAARLLSTASMALCWSRMMSRSRTRATTNSVMDAVTHVLVMSCRDWPAMMPKSSTPSDAAPKIRVIRDK
ncbi:MAG: hypothetical protein DLM62_09900 [Pseudonocardiales bacterium]|nr:MAG: hypothetical protein DLM62_09900 [Pseudonocardiales bacterium]